VLAVDRRALSSIRHDPYKTSHAAPPGYPLGITRITWLGTDELGRDLFDPPHLWRPASRSSCRVTPVVLRAA
jgi:hypothetical protein